MTAKQPAVKKYVVKLSDGEREQLDTLIHKGKHRAGQLVKARILLKADASEAGEGWSDSQIAAPWTPASTRLPAPASNWWRKGSKPSSPASIRRFGQAAHLRRSLRGQADRPGLLRPAEGARAVDAEAAGNCGRRAAHC